MELKVDEVKIPEKIGFNYEELKAQLKTRCHDYETTVYTDDTIKEAKVDRAVLNKLKDNLNAERLRRQREYMHPFDVFKAQVDDLIGIINTASRAIDIQVKDYEERQKAVKLEEIKKIFDTVRGKISDAPDWITYGMVADPKWLLKSRTMKAIEEDMRGRIVTISNSANSIARMFEKSPFRDAATSAAITNYKQNLNFQDALNAGIAVEADMKSRNAAVALQDVQEQAETSQTEIIPNDDENQNVVSPDDSQAVSVTPERVQRVTFSVTARESQFAAVNALFAGLRKSGAEFKIIAKEELS